MLTPQTIKTITELFESSILSLQPTLIHLEHQKGLRPELRIYENNEDTLNEEIAFLRSSLRRIMTAKDNFDLANWDNI